MTLILSLIIFFFTSIHCTLTIYTQSGPQTIPYTIANFGLIPYGKQISGEIKAANPMTNCEVQDDIADYNSQTKVNQFLLILRGDCKFVTKVRNAQEELVKVAIIMDDSKLSGDNASGIVMSADGNSRDIEIPSVFISEKDGNNILKLIEESPNGFIKITINFPTHKTDRPSVVLFSDPNNRGSYIFAREFSKYMKNNMHFIDVVLYHNFYECTDSLCNQQDCYPGTNICAVPPVGDRVGRGLDVIKQSLRERFAMNASKEKGFEYMNLIDEHCIDYVNMQQCSQKQLGKVGIKNEYIKQQMKDQAKIKQYLRESLTMKQSNHIIFFPDVLINNVTYYGELSGLDVFEMVCNSFNSAPKECNPYVYDYVTPKKKGLNGWAIMGIVVVSLVVFFVVMLCVCRRFLRRRISREMNNDINQLVSHYITDYQTRRIEGRIEGIKEVASETEGSK